MPKDQVVHFRYNDGGVDVDWVACGWIMMRVKWTRDRRDVTCNNCLRTWAWRAILERRPK